MKKILVAEDDKLLANAYRLKLGREGYEVEIVADGSEVFEKLQNFIPDLIILDLMMPKMDGFQVLTLLKKTEKWKSIPVLVSSNLGQSEDITRASQLGADDYLIKTDLSMKEIAEKVKKLMDRK